MSTPARLGIGDIPPIYLEASLVEQDRRRHDDARRFQHLYVLPVLLMEFLALALTRAVLPSLLLQKFGNRVYLVMGCVEFVRGFLAFLACPLFGKISDVVGRRWCLLVTVLGTCAPVCSLAFFSWENEPYYATNLSVNASAVQSEGAIDEAGTGIFPHSLDENGAVVTQTMHPMAITVFVVLLSLSGVFASTFTLVFAYISDTVRNQDERVSAYGLALATFGLSFTIGPMAGGYLAQSNKQLVFLTSLLLTVVDLVYIYLFLPESRDLEAHSGKSAASLMTMDHNFSWRPVETFKILIIDPFLRRVAKIAFLYYSALWALISTLSVYAVKRFHLLPERLGELMSALGLCTMVAEAVLVRIVVPMVGEKQSVKIGLVSFGIQCVVLGFASEGWHLFVCAAFSLAGNLVYPSLSSLVSGSVEPEAVGEALGAINGVKALTEGIGPLIFGSLMTLSEHSALPGWPYLLAAVLVAAAYQATNDLPDVEKDDYIHELDRKKRRDDKESIAMKMFGSQEEPEDEYENLLSEIDEEDSDEAADQKEESRLPVTFASLMKKPMSKA